MKKSVIIGGLWGLITIVFYRGYSFLLIDMGEHHRISETTTVIISIVWKIVCFPAYLTDIIFPPRPFLPIILGCFAMSILFGAILGMEIEYLISKFRKNNTIK